MKILIKYSDWLLLNRGEIRPMIGDKIYKYDKESTLSTFMYEQYLKAVRRDVSFDTFFEDCYVEIDYNPTPNLEGLLKDGYTFICPKHGLHPNCSCQDNQIKVWDDGVINPNEAIEFTNWINSNYNFSGRFWSDDNYHINQKLYTTEELYQRFKENGNKTT